MKKNSAVSLPGRILALAGIVMMGIGIMRGETVSVFAKAIRICLECIGIG